MSGIKVTNERPARPIPDTSSVEGVVDDENVDWDPATGGTVENDQWKQPVRVATTATITIATALNAGDSIDGVTLAAGDRVLVKDQSAPAQNGIYVAGTTPARAVDLDDDDEVLGAVVYVVAGTANAGTTWAVTNTAATDIGTDAIDWAAVGGGGSIPAGTYELAIEGGQSVIFAHGSMGATETFDPTDGNVHTGILDANCTFTLSAPSGSGAALLELRIEGSGTNTWTWPGSVTWVGGVTPDPPGDGELVIVLVESVDGGTSWTGLAVGGSASEPTADAHIADTSDAHDASAISIADAGGYYTGTDVEAALQEIPGLITAAAGTAGAAAHAHVASETHLSDGSTTTWTLDEYYEPGSVIAWNTTTIARLTVTEVLPDQATVSAAGSSGDKIVFDYAATVS